MFAFKCLLALVYLVMISVIHHAHATPDPVSVEICRSLIKNGTYFLDNEDSGPVNFINAFKFISLNQMNKRFKAPANYETEQEKSKRSLQHYLTKSYFLELSFDHKLNVSNLKTPNQWCTGRLSQVIFNPEIYQNEKERITDCLEFTTKLLKNDENQPALIFQRMYEDWSFYDLAHLTVHNRHFENQGDKDIFEKRLDYNVRTYSIAYFIHYEEVLRNIDPTIGNFKSIRQFCEQILQILNIHEPFGSQSLRT